MAGFTQNYVQNFLVQIAAPLEFLLKDLWYSSSETNNLTLCLKGFKLFAILTDFKDFFLLVSSNLSWF